jgi:DUF438 domain-containing protein
MLAPSKQSELPSGHPVTIFMQENRAIEVLLQQFTFILNQIKQDQDEALKLELRAKYNLLLDIRKHYLRQEELLFPLLQEKGMHKSLTLLRKNIDNIRDRLEKIEDILSAHLIFPQTIENKIKPILHTIPWIIKKEETEIFPIALEKLSEDEWLRIASLSDGFGYCIIIPDQKTQASFPNMKYKENQDFQIINFSTGRISQGLFEKIMENVPLQLSFIDANDKLVYFSPTKSPIFRRTLANLGRDVYHCHPPKSISHVNQILEDFKANKRHEEEFWINHQNRFIYFQYHAIRDKKGKYLGTLERIQDATRIREIQGEKRLTNNSKQLMVNMSLFLLKIEKFLMN